MVKAPPDGSRWGPEGSVGKPRCLPDGADRAGWHRPFAGRSDDGPRVVKRLPVVDDDGGLKGSSNSASAVAIDTLGTGAGRAHEPFGSVLGISPRRLRCLAVCCRGAGIRYRCSQPACVRGRTVEEIAEDRRERGTRMHRDKLGIYL